MTHRRFLPLAATICGVVCSFAIAIGGASGAVWTPALDQLANLGEATDCSDFTIQLPTGYTLTHKTLMRHMDVYSWDKEGASPGADGGATVSVTAAVPDATLSGAMQLHVKDFLPGVVQHLICSPAEQGKIGKVVFIRCYWKGVAKATGAPCHGMTYLALSDGRQITADAEDKEPDSKTTLPLWEASLRTITIVLAPLWSPNPDNLAGDDTTIDAEGYAFQVPGDFRHLEVQLGGGVPCVIYRGFTGSKYPGGSVVFIVEKNQAAATWESLEKVLTDFVGDSPDMVGAPKFTALTHGRISSVGAVRIIFHFSTNLTDFQGIGYVMQDGSTRISALVMEPENRAAQVEPTLDAGFLTLHKAQ